MGQKRTPTRIQLTARLAALFFCCLCLRGPAEANETSGETPAARTDQAEIALKLEKGYSTVSCPLVAEVTNRSTRDILINMGESFAMMSFDIKLSNRDGPLLDKSARLPCSGPAEMFVIKPGATRKVIIPLDHYFDLDAGEWALDLSWKEFPGLRLPTLNFKIPDHPKPPPGRFANAVGSTRLALARYFEVHGYFPNTLDEMDEKVEGTGGLSNWHYTGKGQSYALWRYAFLQAKIEFDFDSGEKERSAWFYDEGDGSPPKRQDFLLFDAEKRLFDRSTGEL